MWHLSNPLHPEQSWLENQDISGSRSKRLRV
ncbi:Uncharacterised protein [Segatella copri]|nr:Uncharacterised protein [Segatella copri]